MARSENGEFVIYLLKFFNISMIYWAKGGIHRMEMISDIQEIRARVEQLQASQNFKKRKTMSVPEMRKMLGLKKTESYWLVHRNFFKTEMINGKMRVDLESFEKWYANQVKHRKVDGEEPGSELKKRSYSFREAANLLGIYEADLYSIWKENGLETFMVDYVKRISKDVFERWYCNQSKYHKLNHIPTQEELETDYISVREAAELLNISHEELLKLIRYGEYKDILHVIVFDNKRLLLKKSFQTFLNVQNEYCVVRNDEESDHHINIETKEYISREEAATLAGVTKSTITKWMQAEKFACVGARKVLRIRRDDFLQWLNQNMEGVK